MVTTIIKSSFCFYLSLNSEKEIVSNKEKLTLLKLLFITIYGKMIRLSLLYISLLLLYICFELLPFFNFLLQMFQFTLSVTFSKEVVPVEMTQALTIL